MSKNQTTDYGAKETPLCCRHRYTGGNVEL